MDVIRVGDKVKIKDKQDWPAKPGYIFADAEGTVVKWIEYDEALKEFKNFILLRLEKAEGNGVAYIGNNMCFRIDDVVKI